MKIFLFFVSRVQSLPLAEISLQFNFLSELVELQPNARMMQPKKFQTLEKSRFRDGFSILRLVVRIILAQ